MFDSHPRDYWERKLEDAGDLIWERVQRNLDLLDDPQVTANDYVIEYDHPVIGPSK